MLIEGREVARIRRRWPGGGFSPQGWSGVADVAPEWTTTIVASWRPPTIDWGGFILRIGLAVFACAGAVGLWTNRGGFGFLVPAAGAAWFAWSSLQQARA